MVEQITMEPPPAPTKPFWTSWSLIFNGVGFLAGLATVVLAYLVQADFVRDYRETLLAWQIFINQVGNILLRFKTDRAITFTEQRPEVLAMRTASKPGIG